MFPTAHGVLSQVRAGAGPDPDPGGASPLPEASKYQLFVYQQAGSTNGNISELWLGTDSVTRFPGTPTQTASGGIPTNLVNDILGDSNTNSPGEQGSWWGLEYPAPHRLGYVKVARSSVNSLYPRTWTLRLWNDTHQRWLTALARPYAADDLAVSNTYVPFDLTDARLVVHPLLGNPNSNGGAGSGWQAANTTPAAGASVATTRATYVEAHDAILFAWGLVGPTSSPALGAISEPSEDMTIIHHSDGLLLALRTTLDDASEPTSYRVTNESGAQRALAFGHRVLLNVDAAAPIGEVGIALGTATPPAIEVAANQAVLVAALYVTEANQTLPAGFTEVINTARTFGSDGRLRVLVGLRAAQDEGLYQPGAFSGSPAKVVTAAINAITV